VLAGFILGVVVTILVDVYVVRKILHFVRRII
jgi:hypothetical protein